MERPPHRVPCTSDLPLAGAFCGTGEHRESPVHAWEPWSGCPGNGPCSVLPCASHCWAFIQTEAPAGLALRVPWAALVLSIKFPGWPA